MALSRPGGTEPMTYTKSEYGAHCDKMRMRNDCAVRPLGWIYSLRVRSNYAFEAAASDRVASLARLGDAFEAKNATSAFLDPLFH